MTEAAKQARRAYARAWAKKNPDKVREIQARYWEKKAREEKTGTEEPVIKEKQKI